MLRNDPGRGLVYFTLECEQLSPYFYDELVSRGLADSPQEGMGRYVSLLAVLAQKYGHCIRYDPSDRQSIRRVAHIMGFEDTDPDIDRHAANLIALLEREGWIYPDTDPQGGKCIRAHCVDAAAESRARLSARGAAGARARWSQNDSGRERGER